jgi:hypothetical protein
LLVLVLACNSRGACGAGRERIGVEKGIMLPDEFSFALFVLLNATVH